jgi:Flp pilus assembly pilin Flp
MTALLCMAAQKLRNDRRGQDLIEYALIAAFVAVAGGAIFPTTLMPGVSTIFSKLNDYFVLAANQGS